MRTLPKNKQKMWYSLKSKVTTTYELDDDGNKIPLLDENGNPVLDEEGNVVYVISGQKVSYSDPIEFKACISSRLNELHTASYGVSQSNIYSEIVVNKGELPLVIGALIWRETEPVMLDSGEVDDKSADYTVMGLMNEQLHHDWYLLQRNTKEVDINVQA